MTSVPLQHNSTTAINDSESEYGSAFGIDDAAAIEAIADHESDYGSEVDDDTAIELLSQAESQPLREVVLESIEDPIISNETLEQPANLRLPAFQSSLYSVDPLGNKVGTIVSPRKVRETSVEVEYDQRNRTAFSPSRLEEQRPARAESLAIDKNDQRSPLEKFRKNRPISVTDLVSPAWCELQYEYSLSKYGRVRKTPAMKQGTSVHTELEEQVYVKVPVEVVSAEDKFALRIWNTIQGLRSLRETGLTRELEVWGIFEGEVVIGIIDEITTKCPDDAMEAELLENTKIKGKGGKGQSGKQKLPPSQSTLADFLTSSQNGSMLEKNPAFLGSLQERPATCYIVDVKTRQSRTLPAPGSQSRPTHMQLMIYHRLLSALVANEVPADKIFERYRVQPNERFSDKFIAEVANLDVASLPSVNDEDISPKTTQAQKEDSLTELLEHNTLSALWSLLITECARTFPIKLSQSPISPLLTAEFRTARTSYGDAEQTEILEAAGTFIGRRCFELNGGKVDKYVQDEMSWWKGERKTKGVDIEEAYKCRICEFAEGCEWREKRVEEGLRKAKLRAEARRRSEV